VVAIVIDENITTKNDDAYFAVGIKKIDDLINLHYAHDLFNRILYLPALAR